MNPTKSIGGFEFSLLRITVPRSKSAKAWEILINGKSLGNWTPCYTSQIDSAEKIFKGLEETFERDPERFSRSFNNFLLEKSK